MYQHPEVAMQIAHQKINDMIEEARRYRMAEEARKARPQPNIYAAVIARVARAIGRVDRREPAHVNRKVGRAMADPA